MTKAAFQPMRLAGTDCFVPTDDDGREMIAAAKQRGKPIMLRGHPARNPVHHRLLFHLLRKIVEGGAWSGDEDSLLYWLKTGTGHVETRISIDGKVNYVPKSIDYESMSQDRFSRWFDRAVYLISTRLLGSDDWEGLRDEIHEAVEGDLGRRVREHDARYGVESGQTRENAGKAA